MTFSLDNTGKAIFPKSKFWLGGNSEKKITPNAQYFILDTSSSATIVGDITDTETKFGLDCKAVNGCSLIYPDSKSICRYQNWVGLCTQAQFYLQMTTTPAPVDHKKNEFEVVGMIVKNN